MDGRGCWRDNVFVERLWRIVKSGNVSSGFARRRELAAWFHVTFQVSCLRACRLAQFGRASWYRRSRAKDQTALRVRIRDLAQARPRFGYMRIWVCCGVRAG